MAILGVDGVHKAVAERILLDGVALHIGQGERVAIVGDNGAGKSTLLRILAGVETPDAGRRAVRRDLRIGHLTQEPVLDGEKRVRDVVREGMADWQAAMEGLTEVHDKLATAEGVEVDRLLRRQAELDAILDALGGHDREHEVEAMVAALGLPDPDAICGPLSGGEKRRVALARLLLSAPELLLLDEPTNHLDAFASEWLEDRLLATKATLVLVTHDRYFLDRVVTRIVEIDRAQLHEYEGGYSAFLGQRAARLAIEERGEQTRLNLLRRETEWMRRGPPARTTKSKARIQSYENLVASAREGPEAGVEFVIPCSTRLGDRVVRLTGVRKAYGQKVVLAGLDLELQPGDRLGIVGHNGAGKTTLLRICTGALAPDSGTAVIGPTVRFAQIDQTRSDLHEDKTVIEELGRVGDNVTIDGKPLRIETFLEQFGFTGARKHTLVGAISGGERHRVLLAKLLAQGGNVLVLDEPTNDLDLNTLRVLEEALVAFSGAALIVSHDRFFLDRVATRILHLDDQGRATLHAGDLSSFLARGGAMVSAPTGAQGRMKTITPPPSPVAAAPAAPPARKRLSTYEARELEALPPKIRADEAALAALDLKLADPKLWSTPGADPQAITAQRAVVVMRLEGLLARWVELEERA